MKILLVLGLLLSGCTLVGGGIESHGNGALIAVEGDHFSVLVIDRPYDGIGIVPLVIVHKTFGETVYFKPGIGLTTPNLMNSILNVCLSAGVDLKVRVELTHCSNGGLSGKNYGLDYLTVLFPL